MVVGTFLFGGALLFGGAFLTGCTGGAPRTDEMGRVLATVRTVVDGDTIAVNLGGRTETVRLIGVDTPETKHPTKPVGCFGPEASAHTTGLLAKGTRVALVRDVEARDKFGRLLAYVYRVSDNLFVNHELVAGGWGVPLFIEPNTAHETLFVAAASSAEAADLGLWGRCQG